ncbi:hypothetical protein ABZV14_39885 [Streptosporangium canum]|uniref:hypothetical protein n=1 Tax=Streptosporangium canum TaxID=324952 RepID=UPI0033A36352
MTVSADLQLRLPDVDEEALGTMRVWSGATGVARSGIATQTVSTQIRLRDMYAVFAPLPDFKVPLTGSMTAYPHDRYSARFQIEVPSEFRTPVRKTPRMSTCRRQPAGLRRATTADAQVRVFTETAR